MAQPAGGDREPAGSRLPESAKAQPAGGDREPPGSVAFDRAAGFYDESRGLSPAVGELVADRIEEVAGPGGRLLEVGVGAYERGSGSPRDQVIGRFDELAAGGGTPRLVGASHQQVLERLGAMGGRLEELEPVTWEQQETYAEALRWVDQRVFSYQWRLPDEVWRAGADRVRAEIEAAHADLDTPRPARHTFRFTAVRF
jgi:hypothetical protein